MVKATWIPRRSKVTEMKCIHKHCNEEAKHYMVLMEDEAAIMGNRFIAIRGHPDRKTPYCDKHLVMAYERFKNFRFVRYGALK